jgi:hypothetical protein
LHKIKYNYRTWKIFRQENRQKNVYAMQRLLHRIVA